MKNAPHHILQWLADEGRKKQWLAKQVGCGESTLRTWLKGRAIPVHEFRVKLADITGLDVEDKQKWN